MRDPLKPHVDYSQVPHHVLPAARHSLEAAGLSSEHIQDSGRSYFLLVIISVSTQPVLSLALRLRTS
jgi:hypothetical protein